MKKVFILTGLISSYVLAAPVTTVTEDKLLKLIKNEQVPQLEEIKAKALEAQANSQQAKDSLGVEVYGSYQQSKSKEKSLIPQVPSWSPVTQYQVGLRKNFKYGMQADLSSSVDKRSNESGTYSNLYTATHTFALNIDLWKDLFGKVTRAQLENAQLNNEQNKIQEKISEKTFKVSLRRLYWVLVANEEKIRISKRLYDTSLEQLKDAKRRKANSIADAAEVARYQSQVAQRKGSIYFLEYEREGYLKQLRSFIPSLSGQEIKVGKYNLDKTVFEVLECTTKIAAEDEVPYKYTDYDEMTKLIKQLQANQEKIDGSYDSIDVKLSTKIFNKGVGSETSDGTNYAGSLADAHTDMADNDRKGSEIGLMVTIPIGKKYSNTEDVIKSYNKKRISANINNIDNNIVATHKQITKSVKILGDVIKAQKNNSLYLKTRLRSMNKKYNQARIPVYALVQDQDALLSSDLSIVDTQLAILNTLLDYFVVFTDVPCGFNK